jgi:hypothetical protein
VGAAVGEVVGNPVGDGVCSVNESSLWRQPIPSLATDAAGRERKGVRAWLPIG